MSAKPSRDKPRDKTPRDKTPNDKTPRAKASSAKASIAKASSAKAASVKASSVRGAKALAQAASAQPIWALVAAGVGVPLALMALLGAGALAVEVNRQVLAPGAQRVVVIPHDSPWPEVVHILRREQLIRSRWAFELWARRQGLPSRVRAGSYRWRGPMSLPELAASLERGGQTQDVTLTIPEGWTIYHLADRLEALGLSSRAAFLEAACDEALLRELDIPGQCAEGYLFADTYRVAQGSSPRALIKRLHARWRQQWQALVQAHPEALAQLSREHGLSAHDVVILASLVERETNHDPERALIARVFLNRLSKKMRLQTDPTCVYGPQTYREVPSPKRCKDRLNRYSTYVIQGLPPGPIGLPGRRSLEAALRPAQDAKALKALYFVARRDGSGGHHFSATFEEHKRAIDRYLR